MWLPAGKRIINIGDCKSRNVHRPGRDTDDKVPECWQDVRHLWDYHTQCLDIQRGRRPSCHVSLDTYEIKVTFRQRKRQNSLAYVKRSQLPSSNVVYAVSYVRTAVHVCTLLQCLYIANVLYVCTLLQCLYIANVLYQLFSLTGM